MECEIKVNCDDNVWKLLEEMNKECIILNYKLCGDYVRVWWYNPCDINDNPHEEDEDSEG